LLYFSRPSNEKYPTSHTLNPGRNRYALAEAYVHARERFPAIFIRYRDEWCDSYHLRNPQLPAGVVFSHALIVCSFVPVCRRDFPGALQRTLSTLSLLLEQKLIRYMWLLEKPGLLQNWKSEKLGKLKLIREIREKLGRKNQVFAKFSRKLKFLVLMKFDMRIHYIYAVSKYY